MNEALSNKIHEKFQNMAIYKNGDTNNLFAGRNLPSFVKDFIIKRFIQFDGSVDKGMLTNFLDQVIPKTATEVKDKLGNGLDVTVLTRFVI